MTLDDPFECAFYLITRASLVVTSALRRELGAAGVAAVRPAYLGVLLSLWQEDALRSVELGRRAGLEPSTMTGLLDRMARDGLLTREPDPDDRRAHKIQLTALGRQIRDPVSDVVDKTLEMVLHDVPEGALEQLKVTLRQVLTNAHRMTKA